MSEQKRTPRNDARTRSRALQQDILELIHGRALAPGDPLPTETELVDALGVGRNTVREALKVLQATGVVDIRHGYGTFVASTSLDSMAVPLEFHARLSLRQSGHEALELVDVRQALECGLIGAACEAMTDDSLDSLRQAVEAMEADAASGRPLADSDREFHRRLFDPLDNGLLSNLLSVFWRAYVSIHAQVDSGGVDPLQTAAIHREIYEAVSQRRVSDAELLMARHFDGIRTMIDTVVGRPKG